MSLSRNAKRRKELSGSLSRLCGISVYPGYWAVPEAKRNAGLQCRQQVHSHLVTSVVKAGCGMRWQINRLCLALFSRGELLERRREHSHPRR